MSKYKIRRLKQNPHLIEQQKKVDLSLNIVAKQICEKNNRDIISNVKIMDNDYYSYKYEDINIHKVNGILRFSPTNTGNITMNIKNSDNELQFVTILRHRSNLHITLHKIFIKK